jgi:glycosidase
MGRVSFRLLRFTLVASAFCLSTLWGLEFADSTPIVVVQPGHAQLPWYVSSPAIERMMLKLNTKYWRFKHLSLESPYTEVQLKALRSQGIYAVEVFAPEAGGNSYDGLDTTKHFALDTGVGSIEQFREMVRIAHKLGMHVITFQNFGYSGLTSEEFVAAEDAERKGKETRETRFFYWSDRADAPPPAHNSSYFLVRPKQPGYDPEKKELWQWSGRAQKYYWTRWPGKDAEGNSTHLPQYNWSRTEWPKEAAKVIRFWMGMGLDGMVFDAVNWYTGIDWQKNSMYLTGVAGLGMIQPEGGGAFHTDDPVGWITEGDYTNLFDYGLDIPWEKDAQPLRAAVREGKPQLVEQALRAYHDRVLAAGGTLYIPVPDMKDAKLQAFLETLLVGSGDMLCYCGTATGVRQPAEGISPLLHLKAEHRALYQNSTRRMIRTDNDQQYYAILRASAEGGERLLLVFNFADVPGRVRIDTRTIRGNVYVGLQDHRKATADADGLTVDLAAHGYQIFQVI